MGDETISQRWISLTFFVVLNKGRKLTDAANVKADGLEGRDEVRRVDG